MSASEITSDIIGNRHAICETHVDQTCPFDGHDQSTEDGIASEDVGQFWHGTSVPRKRTTQWRVDELSALLEEVTILEAEVQGTLFP